MGFKSILSIIAVILIATAAKAAYNEKIIKIVDQEVERLDSSGEPTGEKFIRRFVLTDAGLHVRLGNGRYYMVLTGHGYDGLGPSDNVTDIVNEGEYGMYMHFGPRMKAGLPDYLMHWEETGKRQEDTFSPISTNPAVVPAAFLKAFKDGPKKETPEKKKETYLVPAKREFLEKPEKEMNTIDLTEEINRRLDAMGYKKPEKSLEQRIDEIFERHNEELKKAIREAVEEAMKKGD